MSIKHSEYTEYVAHESIDTFLTSFDHPKRGRPPKLNPEAGLKQTQGQPEKTVDPNHPAPRPVGRPRKYPIFGVHPPAVSIALL